MIKYHGGPITPQSVAIEAWTSRHAMVSYAYPWQIAIAAEVCQSFVLDNGAFSMWRAGEGDVDAVAYAAWVEKWMRHPSFSWCLIPDKIDGDEEQNDALIASWPLPRAVSVPVWHLHESLGRLESLMAEWPIVALGSSGDYAVVGADRWWVRMSEVMNVACDAEGRPRAKLHGLRMLDPTVFSHLPLSSADSTNVAQNHSKDKKWTGPYVPLDQETRALVLARRIEAHASAARWNHTRGVQKNFELVG